MMFSIIIPTYNREHILPRAINSVLHQSYQNFEILVIDDGSTDNTKQLIKKKFNNPKIKYFKFLSNQGVHQARNKGIDLAQGKYILFLDSDDELYLGALKQIINIFNKDKNIGYVLAPYHLDDGSLSGLKKEQSTYVKYEELLCGKIFRTKKSCLSVIRRDLIGNIRWNIQHLQFIFYRKIAKQTKIFYIAKPLGIYHYLNNTFSVSQKRKLPHIRLSILRAKELDNFLNEFSLDILKFCPVRISTYAYGAAVGFLLDNKKKKAIKYARLSYRYNKKRIKFLIFLIFTYMPYTSQVLRFLFRVKRIIIQFKI